MATEKRPKDERRRYFEQIKASGQYDIEIIETLRSALHLGYPLETMERIVNAKSGCEVSRIMVGARHKKFGK